MAHLIAGPIADVVGNRRTFIGSRPLPRPGGTHYDTAGPDDPRGDVTNEDYVGALVRFAGGAQGTLEACRVITGSQCDLAFEVHGTRGRARVDVRADERAPLLSARRRQPGRRGLDDRAERSGPPAPSGLQPRLGRRARVRRSQGRRGGRVPDGGGERERRPRRASRTPPRSPGSRRRSPPRGTRTAGGPSRRI